MEQKFYEKCSWFPTNPKDKIEKTVHRHGCCDLVKICRRWAQALDYSPGRASIQECVQLLAELLADGGCTRDVPISCRCRESLQDSYSLAMVLSPAFQVLLGCHEEKFRLGGVLKSPLQLLSGLFLPLDVMRCWHTMVTADPWLQDLLEDPAAPVKEMELWYNMVEVRGQPHQWSCQDDSWKKNQTACSNALVPRPQGMCLSCKERQAVLSEASLSFKRCKFSNQQMAGRKSKEYRNTRDIFECLCNPNQTCNKDSSGKEEHFNYNRRQKPGLLSSIQQLKNSLKKDLETHQLYLNTIETRLSGLERRAQDVTKNLERANLELEAIKQGSVHLKTLVDEQISSPVTEDLQDLEESLWEQWRWNGLPGRSVPPKFFRKNNHGRSCAREYPEGGSRVYRRSELQTCKHHVDVLVQQITQQIHQKESEIRFTSTLYQNAG